MSTPKKIRIRNSTAEFLVFTAQAGEKGIEVRVEDGTIWLTQKLISTLFEVDVRTVSEHLKNIFASAELAEQATLRNFRTVQTEGGREVTRNVAHYQLDAIIAVGFRVNSTLRQWLQLNTDEADLKRAVREAEAKLDQLAYEKYPQLTETEIKTLVVDDKWLTTLAGAIHSELDRVSQTLTSRIRQLADRYAAPLPQLVDEVAAFAAKVDGHLKKMEAAAK